MCRLVRQGDVQRVALGHRPIRQPLCARQRQTLRGSSKTTGRSPGNPGEFWVAVQPGIVLYRPQSYWAELRGDGVAVAAVTA
jgi:hypothetical protein